MKFWEAKNRITEIDEATQNHKLDCHQPTYYNVGDVMAFVDGIPIPQWGSYSEKDFNIVVHYDHCPLIAFAAKESELNQRIHLLEREVRTLRELVSTGGKDE